jgi:hypothetical protein
MAWVTATFPSFDALGQYLMDSDIAIMGGQPVLNFAHNVETYEVNGSPSNSTESECPMIPPDPETGVVAQPHPWQELRFDTCDVNAVEWFPDIITRVDIVSGSPLGDIYFEVGGTLYTELGTFTHVDGQRHTADNLCIPMPCLSLHEVKVKDPTTCYLDESFFTMSVYGFNVTPATREWLQTTHIEVMTNSNALRFAYGMLAHWLAPIE